MGYDEGNDGRLIYHHVPFNEARPLSRNEDTARARVFFSPFARPPLAGSLSSAGLKCSPAPGRGMSERWYRFAWCARIRFAVIALTRPVSLARRSFDYSKSTCGLSAPFR